MILSNFLLLFVFKKSFYYNFRDFTSKSNLVFRDLNEKKNILDYNQYSKVFIANSTYLANHSLVKPKKNDLIPRNFFQKLINDFFQETIFLSTASDESSRHVNKLRKLGLAVYKGSEYRYFLNKFSKDLVNGKIKVKLNDFDSSITNNFFYKQKNQKYLRYVWFKFIDFEMLRFQNSRQQIKNNNHYSLVNHSLPLFIIANENREIIMAESTDQLSHRSIILKLKSLFMKNNFKKLYTGLIFVSHEDALEYKNYIESFYSNSTCSSKLTIIPTNMSIYYKFMYINNHNFEFRLIPDLKEVSNLVFNYRKNRRLSFENLQKYGKNFFQGQPIYFIKPFSYKKKSFNKLKELKYSDYFYENNGVFSCKAVFLNYQTLVDMWQRFTKENNFINLSTSPDVHVSNLETFINKSDYQDRHDQLIFLPSVHSYDFIYNYLKLNSDRQFTIFNAALNRLFHLKTFCYRIFWSLTVRQPINL